MDDNIKGYYTPHFHFKTQLYKIIKDNWIEFVRNYSQLYEYKYGPIHDYQIKTIDKSYLGEKIGRISNDKLMLVKDGLKFIFDI